MPAVGDMDQIRLGTQCDPQPGSRHPDALRAVRACNASRARTTFRAPRETGASLQMMNPWSRLQLGADLGLWSGGSGAQWAEAEVATRDR